MSVTDPMSPFFRIYRRVGVLSGGCHAHGVVGCKCDEDGYCLSCADDPGCCWCSASDPQDEDREPCQ